MRKLICSAGLIFGIILTSVLGVVGAQTAEAEPAVNWEKFLARQDLVWNSLPKSWNDGAFIGNGLLGAMIYSDGTNTLQWDVGRSDVTDNGDRIAIGRFVLQPGIESEIKKRTTHYNDGTMRLDLWNAEARGTLHDGAIRWRSFTHATDLVNVIDVTEPADDTPTKIIFQHLPAFPARLVYQRKPIPEDEINPAATSGVTDYGAHWCQQNFKSGGGYVVAWDEKMVSSGHRLFFFTVDYAKTGKPDPDKALARIQSAMKENFDDLVASHRAWWRDFYPKSFLSIPDARMESFYWIQMYKLGSATRANRPAIDLMGPWFHRTPWPHIWWNLNIQLTYWPVYAANHLELGESFIHLIDDDLTNFINNVPKQWSYDSAGVGRSSPYDGKRSVPGMTGSGVMERGDLTWALHNYWLQYRYSGDEKLLRDRLYPKLNRAIAYYLHLLTPGANGKLHLPLSTSPEYPNPHGSGNALVHDANYDLSLLRWGLNTLLAINQKFDLHDSLAEKWSDTLKNLTPNPVDENGYMVGSDQPFAVSHRHFSHLFAIYPLHLVDSQSAKDRPLIEKSLDHWASMPKAWRGYSYTGASAMSAWLGRKNAALKFLQEFLDKPKTVLPNTMYVEAGPVIETPLSGAASIQQLVLQSWSMKTFGTRIRIFPAVPDLWKNVSFDKLLAEGAFEISAVRKNGKTEFVQIKSLAGNPCRVETSLEGKIVASGGRKFDVTTETDHDGHQITVIDLKKDETALLTSVDEKLSPDDLKIMPVNAPGIKNYYGWPKNGQANDSK